MSQYLQIWRVLAKSNERLAPPSIAAKAGIEPATTALLLTQMARAGYVERFGEKNHRSYAPRHAPAGVTIQDCIDIAKTQG